MQILWIRHGQTPGNVMRRYVGRTEEGLTDDAKSNLEKKRRLLQAFQIRKCAEEPAILMGEFIPDVIYCSPMIRCLETAEILFPKREMTVWEGLQETDFGDFEYKNYEELKDDPVYQAWIDSMGQMTIPNGESGADFRERCCTAYEKCVDDARRKQADRIVIVCHGGTIMSVMERYGIPKKSFYDWQIANGCGILTETVDKTEVIENNEEKRGVYYGIREIGKWE